MIRPAATYERLPRAPLGTQARGPAVSRSAVAPVIEITPRTSLADAEVIPRIDAIEIPRNEIPRKLLHILPGFLAFLLPWLPHTKPLSGQSLFEISAITIALTGLYIALRRRVERPNESDFYLTTLSYPAAILGMLFAYPAAPELASVVLVVLAFGDGSAYLAGTLIGGRRLPWNSGKTWAGTAAFAVVGGTLATLAYGLEADPGSTWLAAVACGAGAALVAAIAESLPVRLSDNVRVGFAASATVAMIHFLVVPTLVG